MTFRDRDPLTGATRDAILVAAADADALGLADGAPVLVRSEHGELRARVHVAPASGPGTCRCSSPRATCSCRGAGATPRPGVPDYNALVELVAL